MIRAAVIAAVVLGLVLGSAFAATPIYSSCVQNGNGYSIVSGKSANAVAYGYYTDSTINTTGWATLSIATSASYEDSVQAYCAGFLEGSLTSGAIYQSWFSMLYAQWPGSSSPPAKITAWFQQHITWIQLQVKNHPTVPYWKQVGLVVNQLQGMADAASKKYPSITLLVLWLMNADGDIDDINSVVNDIRWDEMPAVQVFKHWIRHTHCSVIVKVTPDLGDLYASHTTWSDYTYMLRIFKSYNLQFDSSVVQAQKVIFSSYPGYLSSVDDWYVTSAHLVVTETTNGFFNSSLYQFVVPQSVLSWMRATIANRLSASGPQWVQTFSQYNSGTYCNQWIVVDYNLFRPLRDLAPNTLTIAEQIPGTIMSADVTKYLSLGYWPSYNIPFFPEIFQISGFPAIQQQIGDWFSYQLCPRAKMFKRDHNKVNSLTDLQTLLRYNDWQHDPFSDGNPGNAISSRFDLAEGNDPSNPDLDRACFGSIDGKVANRALAMQVQTIAQSGPTKDTQPPFRWSDWPKVPRQGQPDVFNFPWVFMSFDEE